MNKIVYTFKNFVIESTELYAYFKNLCTFIVQNYYIFLFSKKKTIIYFF